MHIGSTVSMKKDASPSVGIITRRPAVSNCWEVRWTAGARRGTQSIVQERELVSTR
jgi:hypothetical protein